MFVCGECLQHLMQCLGKGATELLLLRRTTRLARVLLEINPVLILQLVQVVANTTFNLVPFLLVRCATVEFTPRIHCDGDDIGEFHDGILVFRRDCEGLRSDLSGGDLRHGVIPLGWLRSALFANRWDVSVTS